MAKIISKVIDANVLKNFIPSSEDMFAYTGIYLDEKQIKNTFLMINNLLENYSKFCFLKNKITFIVSGSKGNVYPFKPFAQEISRTININNEEEVIYEAGVNNTLIFDNYRFIILNLFNEFYTKGFLTKKSIDDKLFSLSYILSGEIN